MIVFFMRKGQEFEDSYNSKAYRIIETLFPIFFVITETWEV